jgi:DNA-binding transcriptional ArsR family regulator
MEARRDVFQAIADPTRRAIIGMIAKEPVNVNSIAGKFDVSRQAISLHLKILFECGLLNMKQQGRERICEARLEPLQEVSDWADQYRQLWAERFSMLDNYFENIQKKNNPGKQSSTKKKNSINTKKRKHEK